MYTKEDGYMAYFEVCKFDTEINPDIQSAVGKFEDWKGKRWSGHETVESANVKLDYLVKGD